MHCDEEELGEVALGASLHDIGKIGIPDAAFCLSFRQTEHPEETEIMRRHVNISYDLVSQHLFLSHAAQIVLSHHESYDGSGYPKGLIGNEIPLGARIFAVADTLDAMTSDRPYRAALPYRIAREEIKRCSGSQFDPEVVRGFSPPFPRRFGIAFARSQIWRPTIRIRIKSPVSPQPSLDEDSSSPPLASRPGCHRLAAIRCERRLDSEPPPNTTVALSFVIPSVPGFPTSQLLPVPLMWFS